MMAGRAGSRYGPSRVLRLFPSFVWQARLMSAPLWSGA